ncbi:MAG: hypothetical protein RI958_2266 [Actinomycetota bacterium]
MLGRPVGPPGVGYPADVQESFVVPDTVTWVDGDVRVAVAVPRSSGPVPAVLVLDGQSMFLTATEFARTTSLVTLGALPPIAIVGVWRERSRHLDYVSTRFRDFTPYEWILPEPFAKDNALVRDGTGGAEAFLDLIETSVVPTVRSHIDVAEMAVAGWSLSGLFASWAWSQRPDLFAHLLAISPSLWWCDGRLLDEELSPRPGARAFVSAGEREEGDMSLVWPQIFAHPAQRDAAGMVRHAVSFGTKCADAGAVTETVVFADEHHVTLVPASLSRGLRHLFAVEPERVGA